MLRPMDDAELRQYIQELRECLMLATGRWHRWQFDTRGTTPLDTDTEAYLRCEAALLAKYVSER